MYFIALLVIVICLIAIAYRDLKLGLLSLAAVLGAGVLFYWLSPATIDTDTKTKLEIQEAAIERGYAGGFVLKLRLHNQYDNEVVNTSRIRTTLSDCNSDQSECLTVGQEDSLVKTRIPPGQARDIVINLRTKVLNPLRGEMVWKHEVVSVER